VCAVVICIEWRSAMVLYLTVVTSRVLKCSINPISTPNPFYSHTHTRYNILNSSKRYSSLNIFYSTDLEVTSKSTYSSRVLHFHPSEFDSGVLTGPIFVKICLLDLFYISLNTFHLKSSTLWDIKLKVTRC
jgi:hypothetical protein